MVCSLCRRWQSRFRLFSCGNTEKICDNQQLLCGGGYKGCVFEFIGGFNDGWNDVDKLAPISMERTNPAFDKVTATTDTYPMRIVGFHIILET